MTDSGTTFGHSSNKSGLPDWLIDSYWQTLFEVRLPSGTVVLSTADLGGGVGAAIPSDSLTVITAYNTGADRSSTVDNVAANNRLRQYLKDLGNPFYEALGF